MKKNTKQRRRTKARKDRQAAVHQRAAALFNNWLRTPTGRRASQVRNAALMVAIQRRLIDSEFGR